MTTDRRLHLSDGNMFRHYADSGHAVIPEGAIGTLVFQTAAEIEAERLARKQLPFAEPVFTTRRNVNSQEVSSHIAMHQRILPVLMLTEKIG